MTNALAWYRDRVAHLERQLDDARAALAHMHAVCTEQQAEIARLQAVERQWFRTDV